MNTYKKIRISKTETKDEHRLIMERFLGRKLSSNEVVHHKDGNKRNNDINNLEVMSRSKHSKLHAPIIAIPKTPAGLLRLKLRMQGVKSPGAVLNDELVQLILSSNYKNMSSRKVAKEFKVAHTTIARIRSGKNWSHIKQCPVYRSLLKQH
jgi:hypothetical protein